MLAVRFQERVRGYYLNGDPGGFVPCEMLKPVGFRNASCVGEYQTNSMPESLTGS